MVDVYNTCSYFVRERSYLHRLATYGDIRNRTKLCESRGSKGDGSQGVARIEGKKSRVMRPSMIAQLVKGRLQVPAASKTVHVTNREMVSLYQSDIARNNKMNPGDILNR